jgi:hypothetical protein
MRFFWVSRSDWLSAVMAAICSGWSAFMALVIVEAVSTKGPFFISLGSSPNLKRPALGSWNPSADPELEALEVCAAAFIVFSFTLLICVMAS